MIKTKLISPKEIVYEGEVYSVTAPAINGQVTILPRHANYATMILSGEITLKDSSKKEIAKFKVGDGYLYINDNVLTVLSSQLK